VWIVDRGTRFVMEKTSVFDVTSAQVLRNREATVRKSMPAN